MLAVAAAFFALAAPGPDLSLGVPGLAPPRLGWVDPDTHTVVPTIEEGRDDNRNLKVALWSIGLAAGVLAVGTQAWWEDGLEPFNLRETGSFEKDTYAGGSDKLGHLYSALVSLHIVANVYEWLGLERDSAAWGSALFTTALFNGFEVIDGFTEFGFEYGDVIANTLGITFGLCARLFPTFDNLFGIRMGYVPSKDFLAYDKSFLKFINDYVGMLYFFDVKLRGVLALADVEPGPARFLLAGVAYTTEHYSPVRRDELRQRLLGAHVGIDFAEVLRAVAQGDEAIEDIARVFDLYAVGGLSVVLFRDLNNDQWILNFGVANRLEIPL